MNDYLMTITQAARALGLTRQRIHQAIQSGILPAFRREFIAGISAWFISPAQVERYRVEHKGHPGRKKNIK